MPAGVCMNIGQCACTRMNLWIYVHSHVCLCTHAPTKTHHVETTWVYCVCTKVCDAFMRLIPNECQRRTDIRQGLLQHLLISGFHVDCLTVALPIVLGRVLIFTVGVTVQPCSSLSLNPDCTPKTVRTTVRGLEFVGFFGPYNDEKKSFFNVPHVVRVLPVWQHNKKKKMEG